MTSRSQKPKEFKPDELSYPTSIDGVYKMYTHLFNELGWIVLAENRKDKSTCKIQSYKEEIVRLIKAIEEKITYTEDKDTEKNLRILHFNLHTLMDHVVDDFGPLAQKGGSKKRHQKKNSKKSLKGRK